MSAIFNHSRLFSLIVDGIDIGNYDVQLVDEMITWS